MCEITREMVRKALEETKRNKPSQQRLTGIRKDSIDVRVIVNGKEYGKIFTMSEVRDAYGKAMKAAGVM